MKATVIGGSGFLGSHLVDILVDKNYLVSVFDKHEPHRPDLHYRQGNIVDEYDFSGYLIDARPDVVFDFSGKLGTAETFDDIATTISVNIQGTVNVLEAVRKHNIPLVYISLANSWLNPYTITKQTATRFCMMFAKSFGMKVSVVKALNAYGERQKWHQVKKIAPEFITRALKNETININGSGNQIVDMVYAGDIAKAMYAVWDAQVWGEELECGTGRPMKVKEVAETIIKASGSTADIAYGPLRRGEPENSITISSPAKLKHLTGYYPDTRFEYGIQNTIAWYRKNYE